MEGQTFCKEESILETDQFLPYGRTDLSPPMSPNPDCAPHAAEVSCHFFYPSTGEDSGAEVPEESADPLAADREPLTIPQPELVTVDDQLLELENLSDTFQANNFSLVDPLKIIESSTIGIKVEIDVDENQIDCKPSVLQLEDYSRKRNHSCLSIPDSPTVSSKKMCRGVWIDSNIDLMECQVNIGPKLPLPQCFQQNNYRRGADNSRRNSGSTFEKEVEMRPKRVFSKNIVLKIYTCPTCHHKCTDLQSHEAHITDCHASPRPSSPSHSHSPTPTPPQLQTPTLRKGFYFCGVCSFKFRNRQNLNTHENKHSNEKGFYCYLCDVRLPNVDVLRFHIADQHKGSVKVFPCNICEYTTASPQHLKDHMVVHNLDKHLYCYVCKQNSETKQENREHRLAHQILGKKRKVFKTRNHHPVKTEHESPAHSIPQEGMGEEKNEFKIQNQVQVTTEKGSHVHRHDHQTTGGNVKLFKTQNLGQVSKNCRQNNIEKLKAEFKSEIVCRNSVYYCNGCTFKFSCLSNLTKHKKQHLKAARAYTCPLCAHETLSLINLLSHLKSHQGGKVGGGVTYNCNVCNKPFQHWKYLKLHSVNHVYDKLYCFNCRTNLEDAESLRQHNLTEHGQETRLFSCTRCAYTNYQQSAFKKHIKMHMNNEIRSGVKSVVSTDYPEQIDNNNTAVTGKEKTKDKTTTKDCLINQPYTEVNSSYNSSQEMNLINVNTAVAKSNTKPFNCNKCDFKCYELSLFVKHNQMHNIETDKFACTSCPYASGQLGFYIRHIKTHSEITLFKCKFCGFDTERRSDFDKHVSSHYMKNCPRCAYKTKKMRDFKVHVARHPEFSQQKFSCILCPYTAKTQRHLNVHTSKSHKKECFPKKSVKHAKLKPATKSQLKPHACTFCPFRSCRVYDLNRHILKHCKGARSLNVTRKKVGNALLKNNIKTVNKKPESSKHPADCTSDKLNGSYACLYSCSQCEFVSKYRKSVSLHLQRVHHTWGGVRNNMIVKIQAPLPEAKEIKKEKHEELRHVIDTSKVQSVDWVKCTKCDINNLSFYAKVDHKRLGHNQFWNKPIACPWPRCGARYMTKASLQRHDMKQHCGVQLTVKSNKRKKHKGTGCRDHTPKHRPAPSQQNDDCDVHRVTAAEVEKVEMEPDSDDENYSCGECDFVTVDVTELIKHMFIHSGIPDN